MKLKKKMLLGVLSLVVVFIVLVGIVMYIELMQSTEELVVERLTDQVKSMEAVIRQYEKNGYSEEETRDVLRDMLYDSNKEFPKNLKVDLNGKGFVFILDKSGTNIVHPALEGKNLVEKKTGFKKIFEQKSGMDKYISPKNGEWKITVFSNDVPYEWIVCSTAFKDRIIKDKVMSVMKTNMIVMLVVVFVFAFSISLFISHITKPLVRITKKLDEVASGEGDLTAHIEVRSKDEIGDIAKAFNRFLDTIREMIIEISNSSSNLNEICVSLEQASGDVHDGFDRLYGVVSNTSEGAKIQFEDIMETAKTLSELGDEITQIHDDSNAMKDGTKKIKSVNDVSKESMLKLQETNKENLEASHEVRDAIIDLKEKVGMISEFLEVINGISNQTNLLALNASIEAARVGEAGKGFSVVANEVSKLAEESNASSAEISTIVDTIQKQVAETNNLMEKVFVLSGNQAEAVEKSQEDFASLLDLLDEMLHRVNGVDSKMVSVDAHKDEIVLAMDKVADVSQKMADSTNEVLEISNQFSISVKNIADDSTRLRESSDKLVGMISRFKY